MPFSIPSLTRARVIAGTLLSGLVVSVVAPAAASGPADQIQPHADHAPFIGVTRPAPAPLNIGEPVPSEPAADPAPTKPDAARGEAPEPRPDTTRHEAEDGHDGPAYSRADARRIGSARSLGCTMAETALRAARKADIPFYIACAFLKQETGGGRNVFGHDPTIFAGAGEVTRAKYLRYKELRKRTGEMQGVGPMQLTWYTYQDRADRLGGAWKPYVNMLVGFRHLADLHRALGSWREAARAYNGSGPMAVAYAAEMSHRFDTARSVLG